MKPFADRRLDAPQQDQREERAVPDVDLLAVGEARPRRPRRARERSTGTATIQPAAVQAADSSIRVRSTIRLPIPSRHCRIRNPPGLPPPSPIPPMAPASDPPVRCRRSPRASRRASRRSPARPRRRSSGSPGVSVHRKVPAGTVMFSEHSPCVGLSAGARRQHPRAAALSQRARAAALPRASRASPACCRAAACSATRTTTRPASPRPKSSCWSCRRRSSSALIGSDETFRRHVFAMFGERLAALMQVVEAIAYQKLDQRLAALLVNKGAGRRDPRDAPGARRRAGQRARDRVAAAAQLRGSRLGRSRTRADPGRRPRRAGRARAGLTERPAVRLDLLADHAAPAFDDPLGVLSACHRRIERQLATLARLQRHLPEHGCDHDARAAARGILRYFDTAAVNHHADEEESLFPRLLRHAGAAAAPLLADLAADHQRLAGEWRHLRPLFGGDLRRRPGEPLAAAGGVPAHGLRPPHRARGVGAAAHWRRRRSTRPRSPRSDGRWRSAAAWA